MAPQNNYGVVSPPIWPECWVVAGGDSARHFDFSRARGAVLVVNDAIFLVALQGLATAVFSVDSNWVRRRRVFLDSFAGEKYLAVPLETFPECGGVRGAAYLRWSHQAGLSDDPGAVCTGGNSGYAAINLAYLKGARVIHLAGFDMEDADDRFRQWIPRFRTMLPQLSARGVTVINHNPRSAIDAFPREDLKAMSDFSRRAVASAVTPHQTAAVTIGAAHAESSAIYASAVRLAATVACYVEFGSAPEADTSSMYLPANVPECFPFVPGEKVSVLQVSGGGTLYITY